MIKLGERAGKDKIILTFILISLAAKYRCWH